MFHPEMNTLSCSSFVQQEKGREQRCCDDGRRDLFMLFLLNNTKEQCVIKSNKTFFSFMQEQSCPRLQGRPLTVAPNTKGHVVFLFIAPRQIACCALSSSASDTLFSSLLEDSVRKSNMNKQNDASVGKRK